MDVTSAMIASFAGAVVSAFFEWFPGVAGWFAAKPPGYKQGLMLLAMLLVSLALYVLSCTGIWETIACTEAGLRHLAGLLLFAIIGNQAWHAGTNEIGKGKAGG